MAGRLSSYQALLRNAADWEPVLLANSGLPGPRANLELAQVAADEAPAAQLRQWAASDEEYLALVGTIGLRDLDALRVQANDPRWRVREGVAVAAAPSEGRRVMSRWFDSSDGDVAWVMRENLKKKRIAGVF